jgi:competence protein ComEA
MDLNRQELLGLGIVVLLVAIGAGARLLGGGPADVDWSAAQHAGEAAELPEETRAEVARARIRSTPLEPGERIDVNLASEDELQRLPRVGPALAARIVAHRETHGGFRTLGDLDRVSGIGPTVLAAVAPHVDLPAGGATTAGTSASAGAAGMRIDVNRASPEELERLPGIGPVLARRIVEHREREGRFQSVASLEAVSGIGPALRSRIEPFVEVIP